MTAKVHKVADIFGLWPSAEALGEDLGLKRRGDHARVMKVRGRIPRNHWPKLLDAAQKRRITLTERDLERVHEARQ
jgi:hypothetical protein